MVYLEFNPRDYEKYWKFAQPNGNLVFRDLDPKLQATIDVYKRQGLTRSSPCVMYVKIADSLYLTHPAAIPMA